jgi:signal transduction histidine kinase
VASTTTVESRAVGDRIRAASPAFRLVAAVVLVGVAPFAENTTRDAQVRFGLLVAFGWIPISGLLASIGRRTRHTGVVDALNLAVDLSLLGIVQVVLSPRAEVYVLANLLLVAYYTYVGGRTFGFAAGAAGMVLVVSASQAHNSQFDGFAVVAYPVVMAGMVWMLDIVSTERTQERDRVVRLHDKSDAILTGVAEAVMVTAPDGRIIEWNRAAEHTFVCPGERARNHQCSEILGLRQDVRELDCNATCALLDLHAASGIATGSDIEVWRHDALGNRQPLLATALPVVDKDGTVVEVVHSFRDITRIKQADEAKTLFLATASHELKTPLTVIRGFSQMLLLPEPQMSDDERAAALRAIDLRARQLTAIVDRLLLSSRIEAGRVDLTPEVTDAVPIVDELVASLRAATERDISLAVDDDLPALWVDSQAFATVVDHLLDNAVKYSPGGGPVTVGLRATDDAVEVSVADEGVGMTLEQAAHCFDRFWQAELTDIRRFGGTGIGLYIVRSLVEAMGGRIAVSTAPGEGSTFTVTLLRADRLPTPRPDIAPEIARTRGERSIIREYMRQLGVPVEAQE